ncbi:von Willebrand factor type A domain-containing protein [Nostoc ellipsosporum NOK]|nr:von Willebrand factor type A domain-containing protein [Nostoc ellipsosporum NOK]
MQRLLFMLLPLLLLGLAFRPVHSHQVSGVIVDETGVPVAGVSIIEKGTRTGTTSDAKGKYTITVSNSGATLSFAAVGFRTQDVRVAGNTTINVVLKATAAEMMDVVVTGYSAKFKSGQPGLNSFTTSRSSYHTNADKDNDWNREGYDRINDNRFLRATDNPLSTFSIDVDAASYGNMRRFVNSGKLPPPDAIRVEEMINYFKYDYPQPKGKEPFSVHTEVSNAPWNPSHKLVMIGLQGKNISMDKLPPSNLTFLIDVSGSMDEPDKLPLVKSSMKLLVEKLREQDRVSIVVYAGAAGLVLEPTSGRDKKIILDAIDNMQAGGSTAGGEGIRLAYETARENFMRNGNNRVILCTDGDFNVGASSDAALERMIEVERKSGIYLSVLGFGTGNYQDSKMQKLADKGNGNHAYIDGISEARKVLVEEFGGTLFTIAKDVKMQVEFNPAVVQGYRLIGYENRMLAKEDFNDDKKDAGELGSGHTVTAFYEIIPTGINDPMMAQPDSLKYQQLPVTAAGKTDELMTLKLRYKQPDSETSKLMETIVANSEKNYDKASENFRFAAAVAEFGMLLRASEFKGIASYNHVLHLARNAQSRDAEGYRAEFIDLVESVQSMKVKQGDELTHNK